MGRASRQKRDKQLPAGKPSASDTGVDDETLRRKEMDEPLDIFRKQSDERMVKRINLYKAFADLVKMSPTATALAVAAALLSTGIYKPFDALWANHAAGIALRTIAFAGAFASWVVFNDAFTRFLLGVIPPSGPTLDSDCWSCRLLWAFPASPSTMRSRTATGWVSRQHLTQSQTMPVAPGVWKHVSRRSPEETSRCLPPLPFLPPALRPSPRGVMAHRAASGQHCLS